MGFSFPRLMRPDHYVFTGPPWTVWSGRFVTLGIPLEDWIERGGELGRAGPERSVTLDRSAARGELVMKQIAVLFALPAGATESGQIERAKLRDVSLPFDPEGRPLIWLGEHQTLASLEFLRRLYDAAPIEKVREDVVMAAGLHDHPAEVVEFLDRVLQGDQSDRVRHEAVSALAHFPDESAVRILVRTVGQDSSERVRREAVETLGRIELPSAERALIAVAERSDSARIRREAAESLGRRGTVQAASTLERVVFEDPDGGVQREAVESLGRLPEALALARLERVLNDHPSDRVRREAVESVAHFPDEVGLPLLIAAAERDPSRAVRREAIEQLARSVTRQAADTLAGIASDDRDGLTRHALEALLDMKDGAGVQTVIEIARTHPNVTVRKLAIRELGDSDDPRAHRALLDIIKGARAEPR